MMQNDISMLTNCIIVWLEHPCLDKVSDCILGGDAVPCATEPSGPVG